MEITTQELTKRHGQDAPPLFQVRSSLVTDQEIESAWGNANFGDLPKRDLILKTLNQVAIGYEGGRTAMAILTELGLITRKEDLSYKLTAKGLDYLMATDKKPVSTDNLSQLFRNNADCYTITIYSAKDGSLVEQEEMAMTAERFVEVVSALLSPMTLKQHEQRTRQ